MSSLNVVAPAFHRVGRQVDDRLVATSPTPVKRDNLKRNPYVSVTYWSPSHDTCAADCRCAWVSDDWARVEVWNPLKNAPPTVGYDPAIVPIWSAGPTQR